MILADGLFSFDVQENVLWIVRIIATIGGAVVGWFGCDPLTRLAYRAWYHAATPAKVLISGKLAGGAALALAIYIFLPLGGGGGGGFGWGPGLGGTPGKGGDGGDKTGTAGDSTDPSRFKDKTPGKQPTALDLVEIEIIKVKNFKKDGQARYYLLNRAAPPQSLTELRASLEKNKPKRILVILTKGSFDVSHDDEPENPNVLTRLKRMATEIGIDDISQTQR